MQANHENISRYTETKSSTSPRREDLSSKFVIREPLGFDTVLGNNYEIKLSAAEQSVVNTCWHSRIPQLHEPLLPINCTLPEERFLTCDEQKILQSALRRSIRVISKGTLVSR